MSYHDELFAATGAEVQLAQHGEKAVYRPRGGTPRPIVVIVMRHPVQTVGGLRTDMLAPQTIVKAVNNYRTGIAAAEFNSGGDQIDIAAKKGGPRATRSIGKLI